MLRHMYRFAETKVSPLNVSVYVPDAGQSIVRSVCQSRTTSLKDSDKCSGALIGGGRAIINVQHQLSSMRLPYLTGIVNGSPYSKQVTTPCSR